MKEELAYERELLKKEQQLDPYLEKLLEIKYLQGDEKMMSKMNENKGWAQDSTANKLCKLKIRAVGLDFEICKWIEKNMLGLRDCLELSTKPDIANFNQKKLQNAKNFVSEFFVVLKKHKTSSKLMGLIRDHTSCFGPRRLGSNILINKFNEKRNSFFHTLQNLIGEDILPAMENESEQRLLRMQKEYEQNMQKVGLVTSFHNVSIKELNSAVVSGFDLATVTGPLMDEPMQGAVFILENVAVDKAAAEEQQAKQQEGTTTNYGAFAGQVMSTIKSLCKRAFLNADPRIVEGMYLCSMQASP